MSNAVQKARAWGFLVMLRLEQDEKENRVKLKSRAGLGKKMKCQNRD